MGAELEPGTWLVEIRGHAADLAILRRALPSTLAALHTIKQRHFLVAPALQAETKARCVNELGKVLAAQVNAAVAVLDDGYREVEHAGVAQINDNGALGMFLFAEPAKFEIRVFPATLSVNGQVPEPEAHPATRALEALSRDEDVDKALRLWGTGASSWADLYRVYEVLRERLGREGVEAAGVSRAAERRFKHTANSSAPGDASRHGRFANDPPSRPMPLEEAKELVRGLLRHFLRSVGTDRETDQRPGD